MTFYRTGVTLATPMVDVMLVRRPASRAHGSNPVTSCRGLLIPVSRLLALTASQAHVFCITSSFMLFLIAFPLPVVSQAPIADATAGAQAREASALLALADTGSVEARVRLGELYAGKSGAPPDFAKALWWYLQAADLGDVAAQYATAILYATGRGAAPNWVVSDKWLHLAAERGHVEALKDRPKLEASLEREALMRGHQLAQRWTTRQTSDTGNARGGIAGITAREWLDRPVPVGAGCDRHHVLVRHQQHRSRLGVAALPPVEQAQFADHFPVQRRMQTRV